MTRHILTFALLTLTAACGSQSETVAVQCENSHVSLERASDFAAYIDPKVISVDLNISESGTHATMDLIVDGKSFQHEADSADGMTLLIELQDGTHLSVTRYGYLISLKWLSYYYYELGSASLTSHDCTFAN